MLISANNNFSFNNYNCSTLKNNYNGNFPPFFKGKFDVLNFNADDFFIKIDGYGKNFAWAKDIIRVADNAVNMIKMKNSGEFVLINISDDVRRIGFNNLSDSVKNKSTGILRIRRAGWNSAEFAQDLQTKYSGLGFERYSGYEGRFDNIYNNPLKNPFYGIELTRVCHKNNSKFLRHGSCEFVNNALNMVFQKFYYIQNNFLAKKLKVNDLSEINDIIAEIRWILAHSTPWLRGSDSIANVFMRGLYKALGIKTYPTAKNISLDLEAFCTNLPEYKKNFASYFEKCPEIIE